MFIEKRVTDASAQAGRKSTLPKLSAVLGLTAAVAFVAVIAVAPFTTSQASAEEYAPLAPGETLYQQLDTEPVDPTSIAIEGFEFEVAPEPKPTAAAVAGAVDDRDARHGRTGLQDGLHHQGLPDPQPHSRRPGRHRRQPLEHGA